MSCCATGPCGRNEETQPGPGLVFWKGRFRCYLCYVLAERFPPIENCNRQDGCQLIRGHRPPCRLEDRGDKTEENPTRGGEWKLAAARKRGNLAFEKRHREGPNYVPRHSRV